VKTRAIAVAVVALNAGAATNDLALAREALRDGLWEVARTHAQCAEGDEARLVALEAYAREENWRGLLAAIDGMGYPTGEGYSYYRALALFNGGSAAAASNILAGVTFHDDDLRHAAARLRAAMAVAGHDLVAARTILETDGGDAVDTKLALASVCSESGNRERAEQLWRAVAADTNAAERAQAAAAVGLRDMARLRALTAARSGAVRRLASLRLGVLQVGEDQTFAEGERLIRETVRDKPDAAGALEAFLALGEARIRRGEFAEADRLYSDALEIWPAAAKVASLHEGRGWVYEKLGRADRAIESFRLAEELAEDPERKASAGVKIADALAATGKDREATAAYQRVLTNYPKTKTAALVADVVRLREAEASGRALYAAFKFDEARGVFESLAREDASRRDQMSYYAVLCLYGAGKYEAAERAAEALAADGRDASVRAQAVLWLAKLAYNRSHWRESVRHFRRFAEMAPASPEVPQALVWSARASLAANDFEDVIATVAGLVSGHPDSPACAAGMLAQGEALIELARFDEAVMVLDRAALVPGVSDADRVAAGVMRADALFAMGADNPARYRAALDAYGAIRTSEALSPGMELALSFKIALALEKLKRVDEAIDMYYTQVVLAYRTGRIAGTRYDEAARATFARAAFRLADEYESRGRIRQAVHVLDLVRTSDVQASGEAANRIEKMTQKGMLP